MQHISPVIKQVLDDLSPHLNVLSWNDAREMRQCVFSCAQFGVETLLRDLRTTKVDRTSRVLLSTSAILGLLSINDGGVQPRRLF